MHRACHIEQVVLFAVPGAFTPTCTAKHVPSYNISIVSHDYTQFRRIPCFHCFGKLKGEKCSKQKKGILRTIYKRKGWSIVSCVFPSMIHG